MTSDVVVSLALRQSAKVRPGWMQAGLLAPGSGDPDAFHRIGPTPPPAAPSRRATHPDSGLMRRSSPVTAARPRPILTAFPTGPDFTRDTCNVGQITLRSSRGQGQLPPDCIKYFSDSESTFRRGVINRYLYFDELPFLWYIGGVKFACFGPLTKVA